MLPGMLLLATLLFVDLLFSRPSVVCLAALEEGPSTGLLLEATVAITADVIAVALDVAACCLKWLPVLEATRRLRMDKGPRGRAIRRVVVSMVVAVVIVVVVATAFEIVLAAAWLLVEESAAGGVVPAGEGNRLSASKIIGDGCQATGGERPTRLPLSNSMTVGRIGTSTLRSISV